MNSYVSYRSGVLVKQQQLRLYLDYNMAKIDNLSSIVWLRSCTKCLPIAFSMHAGDLSVHIENQGEYLYDDLDARNLFRNLRLVVRRDISR